VWLAIALLFSTLFRSPATSALAALTLWLVLTIFWPMIAPLIANGLSPVDPFDPMTILGNAETQIAVARISPATIYNEMTLALLHPDTRALGPVFLSDLQGAVLGAPLPFSQSFLLIWPQIASLIAVLMVVFTISYVAFQRQEVRA
jgi:ABC-2 type transport system permease protein